MYHDRTTSIHFIVNVPLCIHQHYYPNMSPPLTIHYQLEVIKQFLDTLLTGDLFITTYDQVIPNLQHQILFPNRNR